jgi:cytochrome c-type biogenesis protein CcmH/NrfG
LHVLLALQCGPGVKSHLIIDLKRGSAVAGVEAADARHDLAQAYFRAGNLERCLELVEQQLNDNPRDIACLTLKGMVLLERDQPDAAIKALQTATELAPDDYEAWSQLGVARLTEGLLPEAVDALRACLRLRPESVRTLIDLGNVLYMQGRTDEALESVEAARRLRPGDLGILRNLAGMYPPPSAMRPGCCSSWAGWTRRRKSFA